MQDILNYTPEGTPFGVALKKHGKATTHDIIGQLFERRGHGRYPRLHYVLKIAEFEAVANGLELDSYAPRWAFDLRQDIRFPLARIDVTYDVPVPECFFDAIMDWAREL